LHKAIQSLAIKSEIEKTDQDIDYELYGLAEEENRDCGRNKLNNPESHQSVSGGQS